MPIYLASATEIGDMLEALDNSRAELLVDRNDVSELADAMELLISPQHIREEILRDRRS